MRRDLNRDREICEQYQARTKGKYVVTAKDVSLIHGISEVRMYQILKRNNIKKREEVK